MTQQNVSVLVNGLANGEPHGPIWLQPEAVLGSAVRYVASLSPKFNWVGIYSLKSTGKKQFLELGPYIGTPSDHKKIAVGKGVCGQAVSRNQDLNVPDVNQFEGYLACSLETRSELVVLIRHKGKIVGQIDIDSHFPNAFGSDEEAAVRQVAEELGELWPE